VPGSWSVSRLVSWPNGDRFPGALRGRRRHGPPGGADRLPRRHRRLPRQRLTARRRPPGPGPRSPHHGEGLRSPRHMPQAKRSLAVVYAANPSGRPPVVGARPHDRGGGLRLVHGAPRPPGLRPCPPRALPRPEKVRFALRTQHFFSFLDTADLCQFVWGPGWELYGPAETVDFVRTVTGWETSRSMS